MTEVRLTEAKLHTLQVIQELSVNSEFQSASLKDIMARLGKKRGAVGKLLGAMRHQGLVSAPLWGRWQVTPLGADALNKYLKKQ
jgi:Mn-dependent DtxR family transcriptional regulator